MVEYSWFHFDSTCLEQAVASDADERVAAARQGAAADRSGEVAAAVAAAVATVRDEAAAALAETKAQHALQVTQMLEVCSTRYNQLLRVWDNTIISRFYGRDTVCMALRQYQGAVA